MSTRRGFLKQALIVMAGATVVTPALTRAVEHIQKYHPTVQAVFNNFPISLEPYERQAIAKFVLAEMDNGNWDKMDSFQMFGMEDENNALTNWKDGERKN